MSRPHSNAQTTQRFAAQNIDLASSGEVNMVDHHAQQFEAAAGALVSFSNVNTEEALSRENIVLLNPVLRNLIGHGLAYVFRAGQQGQLNTAQLQKMLLNYAILHRLVNAPDEDSEMVIAQLAQGGNAFLGAGRQALNTRFRLTEEQVEALGIVLADFFDQLSQSANGAQHWFLGIAHQFKFPAEYLGQNQVQMASGMDSAGYMESVLRDLVLNKMGDALFPEQIMARLRAAVPVQGVPPQQVEEVRNTFARIQWISKGPDAFQQALSQGPRSALHNTFVSGGGQPSFLQQAPAVAAAHPSFHPGAPTSPLISGPSPSQADPQKTATVDVQAQMRGHIRPEDEPLVQKFQGMLPGRFEGSLNEHAKKELQALIAMERSGRYEVVAHLGMGGMGSVWKVRRPDINRESAVKIQFDASYIEREAKAMGPLSKNPGFTTIFDIQNYGGCWVIDMELEYGPTERLDSVKVGTVAKAKGLTDKSTDYGLEYNNGPMDGEKFMKLVGEFREMCGEAFPEGEFFRIMSHIGESFAEAMDQMWAEGLMHRDLKPSNVKIEPEPANIMIRLMNDVVPLCRSGKVGPLLKLKVWRRFRKANNEMRAAGVLTKVMDQGMAKKLSRANKMPLVTPASVDENLMDAMQSQPAGQICGTPHYNDIVSNMGCRDYAPRDMYAFWQTFYEMFSGGYMAAAKAANLPRMKAKQGLTAKNAQAARDTLRRSLLRENKDGFTEEVLYAAEISPKVLDAQDEGVCFSLIQSDRDFWRNLYGHSKKLAATAHASMFQTTWTQEKDPQSGGRVMVPTAEVPRTDWAEIREAFASIAARKRTKKETGLIAGLALTAVLGIGGSIWKFAKSDTVSTADATQQADEAAAQQWLSDGTKELTEAKSLPTGTPEQHYARYVRLNTLVTSLVADPRGAETLSEGAAAKLRTDAATERLNALNACIASYNERLGTLLARFDYVAGNFTTVDAYLARLNELATALENTGKPPGSDGPHAEEAATLRQRIAAHSAEREFCERVKNAYQELIVIATDSTENSQSEFFDRVVLPLIREISRRPSLSIDMSSIARTDNDSALLPQNLIDGFIESPGRASASAISNLHETGTLDKVHAIALAYITALNDSSLTERSLRITRQRFGPAGLSRYDSIMKPDTSIPNNMFWQNNSLAISRIAYAMEDVLRHAEELYTADDSIDRASTINNIEKMRCFSTLYGWITSHSAYRRIQH